MSISLYQMISGKLNGENPRFLGFKHPIRSVAVEDCVVEDVLLVTVRPLVKGNVIGSSSFARRLLDTTPGVDAVETTFFFTKSATRLYELPEQLV